MHARRSLTDRQPCGRRGRATRYGAAVLEGVIVLTVFLTMVFALFDLGLAALRQNALAEGARRLAREAIVHGDLAGPQRTSWGPAQFTGTAADASEIGRAIRPALVTLNPADVQVQITWPDNDNSSGDRVSIRVACAHRTILPRLFGSSTLQLRAESTMRIDH
ncbi:MAG: TadE family protein [Planctomycetaceae bacterium]